MDKIKFVNNSEPALSAENLNKLQDNVDTAKVNRAGDTMTGRLNIENKTEFTGINKTRTINGADYSVSLGVGADITASLELHSADGTNLGRLDVEKTGKIKNWKTGKYLVEETIKNGTITNPDTTKFDIKRSKIVQINNIVFVDLSIQLIADIPINTQFAFKISGVDTSAAVIFPVASYGINEWKLTEAIYAGMTRDNQLYISNQNNKSAKNGFWNIHFSYSTI